MADEPVHPWLATMRAISGTSETPGSADNPKILAMAAEIARRYPEMASYCAAYKHDATPWCGLAIAYCMAVNGIRPQFGAVDVERFLWARSWRHFGNPLERPQLGALLIFSREGGGHVTLYEGEDADNYLGRGGNQSDAINVAKFPKARCIGMVWPDAAAAISPVPIPPAAVVDLRRRMAKTIVGFEARRDANGHLQVYELPAGDGGGEYEVAGINEGFHPEEAAQLKALIEAGRFDEAETAAENFVLTYTAVAVPWSKNDAGLEFFLRDCVFNRGPTGAARILQTALSVEVDGEVGPITLAALNNASPAVLLSALRAAREQYERRNRDESSKFWAGLVNRWNNALAAAQTFSVEGAAILPPIAAPPVAPTEEPGPPGWSELPIPIPGPSGGLGGGVPWGDLIDVALRTFTGGKADRLNLPMGSLQNVIAHGLHIATLAKNLRPETLTVEKLLAAASAGMSTLVDAQAPSIVGKALAPPTPLQIAPPQSKGVLPMTSAQILSIVRLLLGAGGPLAAWLLSKSIDPNTVISIIEWLVGAGGPIIAGIWSMFVHSPTGQVKSAACLPGVVVGVNPAAAPASLVDVARDPSQPKVKIATA